VMLPSAMASSGSDCANLIGGKSPSCGAGRQMLPATAAF
jgi:hypothetical protein